MTTYTLFRLSDRQAQKELAAQRRYMQRLHGRGITCNDDGSYTVTARAYDKLTQQYRIKYEMCLD